MILYYLWKGGILNAASILNALGSNITDFPKTYKKRLFVNRNIRRVTDNFLIPKITKRMNIPQMVPWLYKTYLESTKNN
jgi:hypothetical protein